MQAVRLWLLRPVRGKAEHETDQRVTLESAGSHATGVDCGNHVRSAERFVFTSPNPLLKAFASPQVLDVRQQFYGNHTLSLAVLP